jgi:glycosyltransferase involved in cell wall biosynthesis
MPRVGHNPARFVEEVAQPAEITVTVVNCIPFLSGYYEQSLDVLKAVVESLHATREVNHPYDVMVFDNRSCVEVRDYLKQAADDGKIQYLVLSDTNIGKIGAWNYMFGAAQGKYVVFSDGDVLFRPGWLSASLELFESFPNVGMVTARPLPTPMEYSTATLDWARSQVAGTLEVGHFLDWDVYWEHGRSLGLEEPEKREEIAPTDMYRIQYDGRQAYVGAAHFQFMALADVLRKVIPLPSEQPMRGERKLDIAFNEMGYLRLAILAPLVVHLGNRLSEGTKILSTSLRKKTLFQRFLWLPFIRKVLLWANNQIFRFYFFNVK